MPIEPVFDVSESASFPSLQEEIDRKGLNYIEATEHLHSIGSISDSERKQRWQAVWELLSGLAGEWLIELYNEVNQPEEGPSFVERRVFSNGNETAIVSHRLRSGVVTLRFIESGKGAHYRFKDEVLPNVMARAKIAEIANKLVEKGWHEYE